MVTKAKPDDDRSIAVPSPAGAFPTLSTDRFWNYCWQRVGWKSSSGTSGERLPLNTEFLEPMIEATGSGFDMAAHSVVEVPQEAEPRP